MREECTQAFRAYFTARPDFPGILSGLEGKTVVCHCNRGHSCHGDTLRELYLEYRLGAEGEHLVKLGMFFKHVELVAATAPLSPSGGSLHRRGHSCKCPVGLDSGCT